MNKRRKIGIFGGAFSPPHMGHISAASAFAEQFELDCLYILPSYAPPHKKLTENASYQARIDMLSLAFSDNPLYNSIIQISDYEFSVPAPNYTYDTVKYFSEVENADIVFLVGSDKILSLDRWYRADELMRICRFAVMPRECGSMGEIKDKIAVLREKYNADITLLCADTVDISSSEIRRKIRSGGDISKYVPQKVIDYITENRLYTGRHHE